MKNPRNLLIGVLLIGLIVWGIYDNKKQGEPLSSGSSAESATNNAEDAKMGINIGNKAPDFTLKSMDNKDVTLSNFRGKRVLVNFWATWCPPCRAEMPHMEKFYQEYKDQDVVILGVNLSFTEKSMNDVQPFIKNYGMTFPVVKDEDATAADQYRVVAYPTTLMIDSKGIIRQVFQGAITYDIMKQHIDEME